jgi:glycerol-3-phosphate dehydrogenase (NAD(P)+)
MGHAMEFLLKPRHPLMIWEKYPPPGFTSADLEQSLPDADIILFCLPVNPHREVLARVKPGLKPGTVCLSIAKGLDETGASAAQIFQEVLSPKAYAVMYGPMISEEIRAGHYAFAQLGHQSHDVFARIHNLYRGTKLYIEPTRDIAGISWSVILKNIYAMLFGMMDELNLGANMRGFLMVASLHELDQIVRIMGGGASSSFHLAGLGDLVTTATSEDSHHHSLGRLLARGVTENIEGEGVHTLQMVKQHRLFAIDDYPLLSLVDAALRQPDHLVARIDNYLADLYNLRASPKHRNTTG